MQYLSLYSVENGSLRIYALVPGHAPLVRLRDNDDVWRNPSVYLHWIHLVNTEQTRTRVRDRINFRAVPA